MYKILIVDDERNEREGIEKLIRKFHYDLDVRQADNGLEALEVCNPTLGWVLGK